jgi:hypothetical protein
MTPNAHQDHPADSGLGMLMCLLLAFPSDHHDTVLN